MSSGKIRRRRRKRAWRLKDDDGAMNAASMVLTLADETGRSIEETAAALENLEAAGMIRREEDGSIILLNAASEAGEPEVEK